MNAIPPLQRWWRGRDRREHWLIGTMCLMLAAFAYAYGVLAPLHALGRDARARYDRAAADVLRVREQAETLRRMPDAASRQPVDLARVLDTLSDAGLDDRTTHRLDGDAIELELTDVEAAAVFAWLDRLEQGHATAPTMLHVERRATGVAARLRLPAGRPPPASQVGTP
ncbi:type II secretion system protein GspM [Marilutibacter spongiae]|uniref:Type II secretion system protein M n=1 Tax=Marilutibacter spongiae TaxID=2025720 RepID=A0A7W3TMT1_9GAMM|nr:type II secretion system protein GspM [Lysobacter spongiae]MBB1060924.1 type II secretion system protein M [Lysobacter spongiae]